MRKIFTLICLLPFFIHAGASLAQDKHEAKPLGSTNAPYGYYEYLPGDYQASGTKRPLLIFLAGAGERGNGTTELSRAITFGPGREIEKGREFSFIVLSPQTSGDWHPNELNAFIRYATENYNVDKERIYLTGLSLGAMGILRYVARFPSKIAALLPVSGSGNTDEVCKYSHVPLWAFHGDADDVVPVSGSYAVVNAYNECRPAPSPEAKLTIYPGVGHYAWNQTYDGSAGHDIYAWMLQYSLKGKAGTNQAPVADAGPDKTITLPDNKLSLNGSGKDADGSIASYEWSKLSGPFARLEGRESRGLKLSGLEEGTYRFRLNVKDNEGAKAYDEVRVVVLPAPDENSENEPCQGLLLYPNPAGRELQLLLGSLADEPLTISVLDVTGRMLYRRSFGSQKCGSVLQLDLQAYGLQQGSYLLLIENEKQERLGTLRFLKQ